MTSGACCGCPGAAPSGGRRTPPACSRSSGFSTVRRCRSRRCGANSRRPMTGTNASGSAGRTMTSSPGISPRPLVGSTARSSGGPRTWPSGVRSWHWHKASATWRESAAAEHLPAESFEAGGIQSLRTWLAGRLGNADEERRELTALIREDPGNAPAVERLAVLSFQDGEPRISQDFRRRKAEIDRAQDRARKLMLDADLSSHAAELARLCATLGRAFDAQAWSLVAKVGPARPFRPHYWPGRPPSRSLMRPAHRPTSGRPGRGSPNDWPTSAVHSRTAAVPLRRRANRRLPSAPVRFVDDAEAAGLRFIFDNGQTSAAPAP